MMVMSRNSMASAFSGLFTFGSGGPGRRTGVHALPQFLSGLEEGNRFLLHRNRLAGARVASGAGVAMLDGERAESTQLDTLPTGEGVGDFLENRRHDRFHILATQMRIGHRQLRDQFGLGQNVPPGLSGRNVARWPRRRQD